MIQGSSPFDPIPFILKLQFDDSIKNSFENSEISNLYSLLKIPLVSDFEYSKFSAVYKGEGTLTDAIALTKFSFPYRTSLFSQLCNIPSFNSASKIFVSHITLCSYISFMMYAEKVKQNYDLQPILTGLAISIDSPHSVLVAAAFYRIVILYIDADNCEDVLDPLAIFFQEAKTLPQFFVSIFAHIFTVMISAKRDLKPFMDLCLETFLSNPNFFSQPSIVSISQSLFPLIHDMNEQAIGLILLFAPHVDGVFSRTLTSLLVRQFMIKTPSYTIPTDNIPDKSISLEIIRVFVQPSTEFDYSDWTLETPQIPSINFNLDIIPSETIPLLEDIVTLLGRPEAQEEFEKILLPPLQYQLTHLFAPVLYIIKSVQSRFDSFLLKTVLFDPNLVAPVLSLYRAIAVDAMISEGSESFNNLLEKCYSYPRMRSEVFLQSLAHKEQVINLVNNQSVSIITKCLYADQHIDDITIKSTTIAFTGALIADQRVAPLFFNEMHFIRLLTSFLLSRPLRQFSLIQMRRALLNSQPFPSQTGVEFSNLIEIAKLKFPDKEAVDMVSSVLSLVIDSLTHQRSNAAYFTVTCISLAMCLDLLDESCQEICINAIQLFTLVGAHFKMTMEHMNSLISLIRRIFKDSVPSVVIEKLIQMMAGNPLNNWMPQFRIAQPFAVRVYYSVTDRNESLKYIEQLANYSYQNCVALNKCEFDLLLLDQLRKIWFDNEIDKEFVIVSLSIIATIGVVVSSQSVVQRFVSLLCPNVKQILPQYFPNALNALSSIVSQTTKNPRSARKLVKQQTLTTNLNLSDKGFTMITWIELQEESARYRPRLIEISSDKSKIEIFISVAAILFHISTSKKDTVIKSDVVLPLRKWAFLSLSYIIEDGVGVFGVSLNGSSTCAKEVPAFEGFSSSNVVTFCGTISNDDSDLPAKMGPIALFEGFDSALIMSIFQHGPEKLKQVTPLFLSEPDGERSPTFTSVLVNQCKLNILVPLFSIVDLPIKNGEKVSTIAESTAEIMTNALSESEEAESDFATSNGFLVISGLLRNMDRSHIKYSIYQLFYSMLQTLRTSRLANQLFKSILANPEIWIIASPSDQYRILRHWSHSLFLTMQHSMSFTTLLQYSVIYYFSVPGEESCRRPRPKDLNIKKCWEYLSASLVILSRQSFTADDFRMIVCRCTNGISNDETIHLLQILLQIAEMSPSPFMDIVNHMSDFLANLHVLLQYSQTDAAALVISLIVKLHEIGAIKLNLETHLLALTRTFSQKVDPSQFVKYAPCEFGGYLAYSGDERCSRELLSKWDCHFYNPIPLIILCFKFNDEAMLKPLAQCPEKTWTVTFGMIEAFGEVFHMNDQADNYKSAFLKYIIGSLLINEEKMTNDVLSLFFALTRFFMFFRTTSQSEALSHFFKKSQFCTEELPSDYPIDFSQNTIAALLDKVIKYKFETKKRIFGLRMSHEGKWLDFNLAVCCINLIQQKGYWKEIEFDLFCCLFISKTSISLVMSHFSNRTFSEIVISQYPDVLDMIAMNFESNHNTSLSKFKSGKSPQFHFSYNLSIETAVNAGRLRLVSLCRESNAIIQKSRQTDIDSMTTSWQNGCNLVSSDIKSNVMRHNQMYQRLWSCLTIEKGPWEGAVERHLYYKRDKTPCFAMCPFKLKKDEESPCELTVSSSTLLLSSEPMVSRVFCKQCRYMTINGPESTEVEIFPNEMIVGSKKYLFEETFIFEREDGIELFNKNGQNVLIYSEKEMLSEVAKKHPESLPPTKDKIVEKWKNHQITTFEMIVWLNLLNGRSFNDPLIYPFVPISDQIDFEKFNEEVLAMCNDRKKPLVSCGAVPLEFFFMPEFIGESVTFVYKNRVRLESEFSTSLLEKYFNVEIGDRYQLPEVNEQILPMNTGSSRIVNASLFFKGSQANVKFVDLKNVVNEYEISFDTFDGALSVKNVGMLSGGGWDDVIEAESGRLRAEVKGNSTITIKEDDQIINTIPFYKDSARCVAISELFSSVAVGSEDGDIVVHSTVHTTNARVIGLGLFKPEKIVITPSWGFIAVYAVHANEKMLFVFNINGQEVNKQEIPFSIHGMAAKSDGMGRDYIICGKNNGEVVKIEACSLESQTVMTVTDAIVTIDYDSDLNLLGVVTRGGKFVFRNNI